MGAGFLPSLPLRLSPFGADPCPHTRGLFSSTPGDHHQLVGISAQPVLYRTAAGNSWACPTVVSEKPSGKWEYTGLP